jgi:hypothetical protein
MKVRNQPYAEKENISAGTYNEQLLIKSGKLDVK